MTSYTISLGYSASLGGDPTGEKAWESLKRTVERLRADPAAIVAEARRFNAPETCSDGCCTLEDMAEAYQSYNQDLTVFYRADSPEPRDREIVQYASGSGGLKCHVRRAFCRLVIAEMHRLGIEVNLSVA